MSQEYLLFRSKKRSIVFLVMAAALVLLIVGANAQAGPDRTPGQTGYEPNNAVVNPRNPSQVAVMQGCQVRISNNFGVTFPVIRNTTLGCNGDPSMAFDSQGRLFVSHLDRVGGDNELTVFAGQITNTTTAGTSTYTPIQVSADDGQNDDKQWLAADANPSSPYADNLYLVWTELTGDDEVMFSRSTNQGATWSAPQSVSASDHSEGFVWPTHVAVGPNGDVYLAYHTNTCGDADESTIQLLRDGFGGQNFAADNEQWQKTSAFGAGQATVTCNVQGSGNEIPGTDFWLQGSMQPWILPDPVRAGNVYVVANDDPNNAYADGDDADVVIARSTDFGATFTRSRVDHGPGQSFAVMPTAHIDQDGNIAVHWYDNRSGLTNGGTGPNGSDNFLLDLYGAGSKDGGLTFSNDFRINDAQYDPDVGAPCRWGPQNLVDNGTCQNVPSAPYDGVQQTLRIGEYNGVWAVDGIAYAVWTGNNTPPPGATAPQTTFFDIFSILGAFPDQFEPNESIDAAVVAALGADNSYQQRRLTLHSATDVDFFQVVALESGKLETTIAFNERIADLNVRVRDADGTIIGTGTQATPRPGNSTEALTLPVVQGQMYFVEVLNSAPIAAPYQSSYDLTIVNRAAPVPFGLDLVPASDSGPSNSDDVTNDNTPTIRLLLDPVPAAGIDLLSAAEVAANEPGYAVAVFADGIFAGYADPVSGTGEMLWQFTFPSTLADGTRHFTARVRVFDSSDPQMSGNGGQSASLPIQIDVAAPAAPGAPDLVASSDSGGIDDDNITTITTPKFAGSGEANSLVRLYANGALVGQGLMTAGGTYEVTVNPLADGVYDMTVRLEDLAGNVSDPSPALKVTIANQSLTLPGMTASGPAAAAVAVNLADGAVTGSPPTVAGYPGIAGLTGKIGIAGIPVVNMDTGGQSLTILGTPGDDGLYYRATGMQAGTLTRDGSAQTLNFSAVGGTFTIDPLGGSNTLTVLGTSGSDVITSEVNVNTTVQINDLLTVNLPVLSVAKLVIDAGQGTDAINVIAFDSVNANLFVEGGLPVTNPQNGDQLIVSGGSPKAKFEQIPGGPTQGSGSVIVKYPQTTGNQTRIDYGGIEKLKILH